MKRLIALALLATAAACGKYQHPVYQAVAIDGDTFWQGNDPVAYRLARIDAPEMPGHCRPGRRCVAGDPYRSKHALQWFLNRNARCKVVGRDIYGRKLAECYTGFENVNDSLVQLGFAERYRK